MQQVSEHVDAGYLEQAVPRSLSPILMFNMFVDHLLERPFRTILHPLFILSIAALVLVLVLRLPTVFIALPLGLAVGMVIMGGYRVWMNAWEELQLMRNGLVLRAHVLKLRPNRTLAGDIDGALLDCAIPVAQRRTYVGSIWLADGNEAIRLLHQGRLEVLCLPRTPGTWRVLEPIRSEIRYERVGPAIAIPQDI